MTVHYHQILPEGAFMFTKKFWLDAAERSIKSAAQGALVAAGKTAAFDARTVDWAQVGFFGAGMAALSLLTSIGSAQIGNRQSASLVDEVAA